MSRMEEGRMTMMADGIMIVPFPCARCVWRNGGFVEVERMPPHLFVFLSRDSEDGSGVVWPLPDGWRAHLILDDEVAA